MATTSITRHTSIPALNAVLLGSIATMEHRWRMLMFNGWSNLRMWETHLSEGIQIFRIVSDKWGFLCIRIEKYSSTSEISTEHLSEAIRKILIPLDKWYLFWNANLFRAFFRSLQINFVKVGQMVSIPSDRPSFALQTTQLPHYLQIVRQNTNFSNLERYFSRWF